jgi:diamine N-acetyltransferase
MYLILNTSYKEIMDNFYVRQCNINDIDKLKYISEKTFCETFSEENSQENIEEYLQKNFSYEQLETELKNEGSAFFLVEANKEIAAYMKVNFDKAQTEPGHPNTLEVQRIYVLQEYKGKQIGKKLIQQAIEVGKNNSLNYIWLGVWENNINAIKFYEKQGFIKFDTHIFALGEEAQTDNLMKIVLN